MELPISLLLVFSVFLSPLTAFAGVTDPHALGLARSSFPSVHAQQLIRALNLFPESDANIISDTGDSSPVSTGKRIVKKRFTLHNIVGESGVSVEDLGHHAARSGFDTWDLELIEEKARANEKRRTKRK
ncbi:hypothetical protein ACLB2K_054583 [Fragaria x ananassa]